MQFLDLTLPTMAANLALDEALLDEGEQSVQPVNLLRLWESPTFAVVVGRATKVEQEVNQLACEQDQVPIYRRCSGGTSVVVGPGCLMYAIVINYLDHPDLRPVDAAHQHVMERMRSGLHELSGDVLFKGTCDLTINNNKFSGNALRCKRNCFLYHGTILYDFPLGRIAKYLGTPPRQPEYRGSRSHTAFLQNFPANAEDLRGAIRTAWKALEIRTNWPTNATNDLERRRYSSAEWNLGR